MVYSSSANQRATETAGSHSATAEDTRTRGGRGTSLQGRSDLFALLTGVSGGEDFRIIKAGIRGCYASFNKAD